jgi:DNA-binding CsgD family transcriptional regulator
MGGMALLTPRERDVVRLTAEGMRNQEISLRLNLSEHTVRNYLLRIFDKLGISSRVELVLYAFSDVEGNCSSSSLQHGPSLITQFAFAASYAPQVLFSTKSPLMVVLVMLSLEMERRCPDI